MKALRLWLVLINVLAVVMVSKPIGYAAAQEIGLTPLETTEVAKGYSANALKLRPVDKRQAR